MDSLIPDNHWQIQKYHLEAENISSISFLLLTWKVSLLPIFLIVKPFIITNSKRDSALILCYLAIYSCFLSLVQSSTRHASSSVVGSSSELYGRQTELPISLCLPSPYPKIFSTEITSLEHRDINGKRAILLRMKMQYRIIVIDKLTLDASSQEEGFFLLRS